MLWKILLFVCTAQLLLCSFCSLAENTDSNKSTPRRSIQRAAEFRRAEPRRIEGAYTIVNGRNGVNHLESTTRSATALPHTRASGSGLRGDLGTRGGGSARNFIERVRSRRAHSNNNVSEENPNLNLGGNHTHEERLAEAANVTEHNATSTQQQNSSAVHVPPGQDDEDKSDEDSGRPNLVQAFSGPSADNANPTRIESSRSRTRSRHADRRGEILNRARSARSGRAGAGGSNQKYSSEKLSQRFDQLESRYLGSLERRLSSSRKNGVEFDDREKAVIIATLRERIKELRSEKGTKLRGSDWRRIKREVRDLAVDLQAEARKTNVRRRERTEIAAEEIIAAFYKRLDGLGIESASAIAKDLNEKILWDLDSGMERAAILLKLINEVKSDLVVLEDKKEDTTTTSKRDSMADSFPLEGGVVRAFSGPSAQTPMDVVEDITSEEENTPSASDELLSAGGSASNESATTPVAVKEPSYVDTITTAIPLPLSFDTQNTTTTESHH
jgi:hypothetical protein